MVGSNQTFSLPLRGKTDALFPEISKPVLSARGGRNFFPQRTLPSSPHVWVLLREDWWWVRLPQLRTAPSLLRVPTSSPTPHCSFPVPCQVRLPQLRTAPSLLLVPAPLPLLQSHCGHSIHNIAPPTPVPLLLQIRGPLLQSPYSKYVVPYSSPISGRAQCRHATVLCPTRNGTGVGGSPRFIILTDVR